MNVNYMVNKKGREEGMTIAQITLIEKAKLFLDIALINDLSGEELIKILNEAIERIELAKVQKEVLL